MGSCEIENGDPSKEGDDQHNPDRSVSNRWRFIIARKKIIAYPNLKAMMEMNLQLHHVVADIAGATGMRIIWAREGRLYLATVLNLHSRRVIGWAVSNRMKRDLAIRALDMAVDLPHPPKGCDRGSQY